LVIIKEEPKKSEKGIYDKRNKINDLTGKEWLKLTKSVWISKRCAADKDAFEHPAPFLIEDIRKLVRFFTKSDDLVADIFMGSGTAIIAACLEGRFGLGIDLNSKYCALTRRRLKKLKIKKGRCQIIKGDSLTILKKIGTVDYCVTSPPYHNILKNKGKGVRHDGSQRRQGVEFYSSQKNDVGNQKTYLSYLMSIREIMTLVHRKLKEKKYCSIIISDFTVNKKEKNVHGDVVTLMQEIGFEFSGATILVQDSKILYPFGYPYAYKINHHHQYILNFRKV
jgi:DNA modification methylase